MTRNFKILKAASFRIDDIYIYTHKKWGDHQAREYINGLFDFFQKIADRKVHWKTIPAEFGVSGYYALYEKHYVYWKELSDIEIGIVTILHQRMDKANRLQEDSLTNF